MNEEIEGVEETKTWDVPLMVRRGYPSFSTFTRRPNLSSPKR
jgi:hypothetical protein